MRLKTWQIDFNNVFVQVKLEVKDSSYVALTIGLNHTVHCSKDIVLELLKSLYGVKDSTKFWFWKVK